MSPRVRASLSYYGDVLAVPEWEGLPSPVSSHPDMLFYPLPSGKILVGRDYYEKNESFLSALGDCFLLSERSPRGKYPSDILFDCLGAGDTLYGKEGCVAEEITGYYPHFVHVSQGYTRCSTAMLGKRCAVTADRGISAALKKGGIEVLDIRPGHIRLEGYGCGFIGGAGAMLGDGVYGFFGDLLSHPDGERIEKFASKHKIKAVSLSDEPLSDNGGLLII